MPARPVRSLFVLASLACALAVRPATAQPATDPGTPAPAGEQASSTSRPKIGLALGGGSARGFAHIGVLEWFEENRIPIDYIGGTSMGGLVAGAYATGMNPAEIRALMKEVDWDNMFLADSPYKFKSFRRKEDARAYPSQLKFGLKGGFQLPSGVNPGQRILWLLNRIALPYGILDSFDSLPTPYRCVATDLNKAEQVVLDRGNLSLAMRATMAIPLVFTPVQVGDRLLVDGGALNNIPADVVRQMGADIVIAVDVAADVDGTETAKLTLFGVVGKTIDAMMMPGIRNALKSADVVIDPDLKGLTGMDFRKSDEMAERGLAASKAAADKLLRYRVEESVWQAHQAERARKRASASPEITFVKVNGVDEDRAKLITRAVAATPGQPVSIPDLELSLNYLTGNDLYDTIGYRLEYEDGKPGLVLDVTPKSYAPPFLFFAFDLQNIDSNSFSADFRVRTVFTDVVNAGSELRADLTIGSNQYLGAELLHAGRPDTRVRHARRRPLLLRAEGVLLLVRATQRLLGRRTGGRVRRQGDRRRHRRRVHDRATEPAAPRVRHPGRARTTAHWRPRPARSRGHQQVRLPALHVRRVHDARRAHPRCAHRDDAGEVLRFRAADDEHPRSGDDPGRGLLAGGSSTTGTSSV